MWKFIIVAAIGGLAVGVPAYYAGKAVAKIEGAVDGLKLPFLGESAVAGGSDVVGTSDVISGGIKGLETL